MSKKEEKYEQVLAKARTEYNTTENVERKQWLEEFFPELKKNKDEEIRKAIIEFFELQDDNTTYSFIPKKDILAWLEKQGEQKSNKCDGCNNVKGCVTCVDGDQWAHYKEVEQKPINDTDKEIIEAAKGFKVFI